MWCHWRIWWSRIPSMNPPKPRPMTSAGAFGVERVCAGVAMADAYPAGWPTNSRGLLSSDRRRGVPVTVGRVRLEDEDLDRVVGLEVAVAHEGDHLAPGDPLDGPRELPAHGLLERPPHLHDEEVLVVVDEAVLRLEQRLLHQHDDEVVADHGSCVRRAAARVVTHDLHDGVG